MGRKPNTVISEFFQRGEKLLDSSNRYEHTCRLCGERFPKGRPDTLISHIVKACQAISLPDRDRVVQMTSSASSILRERTKAKGTTRIRPTDNSNNVGTGTDQMLNPDASEFQTGPGLNGLNVLAEASRRVGASNEGPPHEQTQELSASDKDVIVDPALENVTRFSIDAEFHPEFVQNPSPTAPFFSAPSEGPSSPMHVPAPAPATHPISFLPVDAQHDPEHSSSQLSLIAASANQIVPDDAIRSLEPAHEVCYPTFYICSLLSSTVAHMPPRGYNSFEITATDQSTVQNNAQSDFSLSLLIGTPQEQEQGHLYIRPTPGNPELRSNEFYCEVVDPKQPKSKKARSSFTEERRKEVRVVRKMGACLRCRMLKKTCSAGTPCSQCRNLQNPRVWMECCIRTRLMNQLESYSVGLHSTMAFHDIRNIRSRVHFEAGTGRIEVMHFEAEYLTFLTFGELYGQKPTIAHLGQEMSPPVAGTGLDSSLQYIHILDGEVEELSEKMHLYIQKMSDQFVESEQSCFIRKTLLLASELAANQQDEMLTAALELWVATAILVDPFLTWTIYFNPTLPPLGPQPLTTSSNEARIPINRVNEVESYSLICAQLRSAVEKRATKVCKSLLGKYEQRLLQKQHSGNFRTFLATIILLNCVERMEWLFHSWECEQYVQRWPLERRASYFASQIKSFAGIVSHHLKMRSLAPYYEVSPTGIMQAREGSGEDVCRWFDAINIDYQFLQAHQNAQFDASDSRSLDLKYSSAVVLST
ncbi:hypothetical protein FQN57_005217 [Myotisia sp. PD_48]|nr:hypothetical protein FQN57_005217 [Myotisia sp. PD_48]